MGVPSSMRPIDFSAMDLFHFTMQQLAPPVDGSDGDAHTLPSYLRHWLRRHHAAQPPSLPGPPLAGTALCLDAAGQIKLARDLESFYEVPISTGAFATLHTLPEVEAYLKRQLTATTC